MLQSVYLALFTIKEYRRATWFYMETLAVLFAVFVSQDHFWLIGKEYVFITLGILAICLAIITTVKITNRETNPRIYVHMTKALSRTKYLAGKVGAIFLIDATIVIIMYFIAFMITRLNKQVSFTEGLGMLLPILLVLVIAIMVILISSRLMLNKAYYYLLGISYIILGFYQPSERLGYFLPPIGQLIKGSFSKSLSEMKLDFLVAIIYFVILCLSANIIFKNKELDYEQR